MVIADGDQPDAIATADAGPAVTDGELSATDPTAGGAGGTVEQITTGTGSLAVAAPRQHCRRPHDDDVGDHVDRGRRADHDVDRGRVGGGRPAARDRPVDGRPNPAAADGTDRSDRSAHRHDRPPDDTATDHDDPAGSRDADARHGDRRPRRRRPSHEPSRSATRVASRSRSSSALAARSPCRAGRWRPRSQRVDGAHRRRSTGRHPSPRARSVRPPRSCRWKPAWRARR